MSIETPSFELVADRLPSSTESKSARSGTFSDNMRLPVHRWFRYSAGFSAEWASTVIEESGQIGCTVLDPFAGSGTTLLAAQSSGATAIGFESHPFVFRIAEAKLLWSEDVDDFKSAAAKIRSHLANWTSKLPVADMAPELLKRCYTLEALAKLIALRDGLQSERSEISESQFKLVWLAVTAILRPCSGAGTAQWQYVLPNKSKSKVLTPDSAFDEKIAQMAGDMRASQASEWQGSATTFAHDARVLQIPIPENSVDLVVTSPPYANNYDYADATRLEMMFWGEISGWKDLQTSVRSHIVRSCSQHSTADRIDIDMLLQDDSLSSISSEIREVCDELARVRLGKGGKKAYHTMIAAYFFDLAAVIRMLRLACKPGAKMCFVVGDSAPYGVHVPVERWLGTIAVATGFKSFSFEKIRDRNTKWKNRKHTVPLHEGRLWIQG